MAVRQRQYNNYNVEEFDEVANQGEFYLNNYVYEEMQDNRIENALNLEQFERPVARRIPGVLQEHVTEIAGAIKIVAEAIQKEQEFKALVARVPPGAGEQILLRVADSIFSDGVFNWGRVMALFSFAYKVCATAVNSLEVMRNIINVIVGFMRRHVVQWIMETGGWRAILDYMNSSKRRIGFLIAGGMVICAGAFLYHKYLS